MTASERTIFSVPVLLILILVVVITRVVIWAIRHPCTKSHVERVHHEESYEYVHLNEMTVPSWQPAWDEDVTICDEYKK